MKRRKPTIEPFGSYKHRVYSVGALCWSMKYNRKRCLKTYYTYLLGKNLITKSGKLSVLGCALAERHNKRFKSIEVPTRTISDEQREKLKVGLRKRNVKATA